MSEDEISKHSKKIIQIAGDNKAHWRHRLTDIFIEVITIVFAIWVSIWLHNWNDHRINQDTARSIIKGIQSDLTSDLEQLTSDSAGTAAQKRGADFLRSLPARPEITDDSIKYFIAHHSEILTSTTRLNPNIGRYEGVKSSGKLFLIEDDSLVNMITDFYEEKIPLLLQSEEEYMRFKEENLDDYMLRQGILFSKMSTSIFRSDYAQIYFAFAAGRLQNVIDYHHKCMDSARQILGRINSMQ